MNHESLLTSLCKDYLPACLPVFSTGKPFFFFTTQTCQMNLVVVVCWWVCVNPCSTKILLSDALKRYLSTFSLLHLIVVVVVGVTFPFSYFRGENSFKCCANTTKTHPLEDKCVNPMIERHVQSHHEIQSLFTTKHSIVSIHSFIHSVIHSSQLLKHFHTRLSKQE